MQLHDFLCDGKPQPASSAGAASGTIQAVELLKDFTQQLRGNGLSFIRKADPYHLPLLRRLHTYLGSWRSVTDRIAQEIIKHPLETIGVADDFQIRGRGELAPEPPLPQ